MTRHILATLCFLAFSMGPALAQEPEMPKPGAEHKRLADDIGVWDATVKMWMEGPNSEPMVSKAVETNTKGAGEFWVNSEFKGEMFGQPFVGHGVSGFDSAKGKYVGTWTDSMSPRLMVMEGTYEPKTKTITMFSEGLDAMTKKLSKEKSVTQYKDDGTRVFTMYIQTPDTGPDYVKMMEIEYKKRAAK